MIEFPNGTRLVQSLGELPNLVGACTGYIDFETTSRDPKKNSLNPWFNCWVAGIAITVDDAPGAWYLPIGHRDESENLPKDNVTQWLRDIIFRLERWTNHNVKYDMHVAKNDLNIDPPKEVLCTQVGAQVFDSNMAYRGGYGLDNLAKQWLGESIDEFGDALKPYLGKANKNNKDYGVIPADVMAPYAGQDVLTDRRLEKYLLQLMPEQCAQVWATERALTRTLWEMERTGLQIDPHELKIQEFKNLTKLSIMDAELARIVGRSFRPWVSDDCFDVLCNQYGLPVMGWTGTDDEDYDEEHPEETGKPSFDKKAMAAYSVHPHAPKDVVRLIGEYRKINQFNNLFVVPYQTLHVDGILHARYNQVKRTGRMSASEPNTTQLDSDTKKLVHPRAGRSFMSIDYSQIEFRTIVHYIQDADATAAYNADPDTDFHDWVATMCGIKRKPAKTVNFMVGFGGGKAKTQKQLAANSDIVDELKKRVDELVAEGKVKQEDYRAVFDELCKRKAEQVYERYHATLPGIKRTSYAAAQAAREKGYVYNLAGRHRKLPEDKAHIAFNTLNQSSAADIFKERTQALHEATRGLGIEIVALVHDETLIEGPTEVMNDPRTVRDIVALLENPRIKLRVPIRTAHGLSEKNWWEAATNEFDEKGRPTGGTGGKRLPYPVTEYGGFGHLK